MVLRSCGSVLPGWVRIAARRPFRRRCSRRFGTTTTCATPGPSVGWLFSIAQRKIVDSARSLARAPIVTDQLEEHAGAWHDPDPADDVWSQVAALPPKQREAVALRYMADLSHGDIAEAMGTTADAARRNVFEGLNRLRRDLADDPHNL